MAQGPNASHKALHYGLRPLSHLFQIFKDCRNAGTYREHLAQPLRRDANRSVISTLSKKSTLIIKPKFCLIVSCYTYAELAPTNQNHSQEGVLRAKKLPPKHKHCLKSLSPLMWTFNKTQCNESNTLQLKCFFLFCCFYGCFRSFHPPPMAENIEGLIFLRETFMIPSVVLQYTCI